MNFPRVILASASPRRQQFFHSLGIPFSPESADIDEAPATNETPVAMVERLAIAKALTVGKRLAARHGDEDESAPTEFLVVGADTVVAIHEEMLGKPAHVEEAYAMLLRLRGRPHQVHTALAFTHFACGKLLRTRSLVNTTTVNMRCYSESEIAAYVATGDPLDKAGAYAIQHKKFRPVESLTGCPAAVMGLPVADLLRLLAEFNLPVERSPLQVCGVLTGVQCCQLRPAATPGSSCSHHQVASAGGVLPNGPLR
jgi:septum formation protein